MAKLSISIWLFLYSLLANGQETEHSRLLANDYKPQPVEQAIATLIAANIVGTKVEYKAGQSVTLQAGFEAKAGSVFTAHTGVVLPASVGDELTTLTVSAYPNPFDESTTITYVLTKPSRISLRISDLEGKLISQLIDGHYQEAGRHDVAWKGGKIPVGTYVCILEAGPQHIAKRIIRK